MSKKNSIKKSSSSPHSQSIKTVEEEKFHILHSPGYPGIENQKKMEDTHGVDQVVWLNLKFNLLVAIIFLLFILLFKFDLNTITQFVTKFIDLIITVIHI
jgi:hypothetical protein